MYTPYTSFNINRAILFYIWSWIIFCNPWMGVPNYQLKVRLFIRGSLSIYALCACVYIYIRQLSSFRAPKLWFNHLTVATCHIQYTFLSLCHFFHEITDKTRKYSKSAIFVWYENGRRRLLGAQNINTERASLYFIVWKLKLKIWKFLILFTLKKKKNLKFRDNFKAQVQFVGWQKIFSSQLSLKKIPISQ